MANVIYHDELRASKKDAFSVRLNEAQEMFALKHGTNIIGRDIETVMSSNNLFSAYKDALTEGFSAMEKENLDTLFDATRQEILTESLTGVAPFASLTMPVLVKLWARLSMKYAIPTEPVVKPAFAVSFMKPFYVDSDGEKHYLPESINNTPETAVQKKRLTESVTATNGKVSGYNLFTGLTGISVANGDSVDKNFAITELTIAGASESPDIVIPCNIKIDINRRLYGEVVVDADDGTTDIVLGSVDLEKAKLNLTMMSSTLKSVKVRGWVSSESHRSAMNISYDLERRDIEIGTGAHIEGSVPLELLQDTKAMYNVDGASEIVDIMSNVSAQKIDLDIIEFLERAKAEASVEFTRTFDCYPNEQFAFSPQQWFEGLKVTIDHLSQSMVNQFKSYEGYFVVVGNPLDTMLIPNVSWTFRNVNDTMNGVNVTYSLGAVSGVNRYQIISSDLIAQGKLTVFLVPTTDRYKTFVYYPYTFNVVNNYLNTRMPNVPSIMLTRRYTLESFTPIIGQVVIENNDGSVYGVRSYRTDDSSGTDD